jgi:hypothetical protein
MTKIRGILDMADPYDAHAYFICGFTCDDCEADLPPDDGFEGCDDRCCRHMADKAKAVMKKRIMIIGIALLGLIPIFVTVHIVTTSSTVVTRPVRLVVTGPDGQHFSGSYIADGITNAVSAIAPATITTHARDVVFEFKREGGEGEFRVAMFVGDRGRTSTTSGNRHGVRGMLRYSAGGESYWAGSFD